MADVEFQISQLVSLAIGAPEAGIVNFNILQKVLIEILKLTGLENAPIRLSNVDATRLEDTYSVKPLTKDEQEEIASLRNTSFGHISIDPEKVDQLLEDMKQMKFDVEDLMNKVTTMAAAADTVPFQDMRSSLTQVDGLQEKLNKLEAVVSSLKEGGEDRSVDQKLMKLEHYAESHEEQLANINGMLNEKLKNVEEQFENMEKELGELNETLNVAASHKKSMMVGDSKNSFMEVQTTSNINNIISRLSSVQQDLDNLTMITNNMQEDQEQRLMLIDALTEQVEVLKTVKADKTNMEDILAAKADMSQVHRKVSHDHFETKMDQFNLMVEDAFNRLDAHEDMWQEEVEELKMDIEQKLDKMEFAPMRDYVNEKLKLIQDKMRVIAMQKREGMAAGSKKRVIRDVQCISCDNDSVMRPVNTMEDMMPAPPLPAQQSVKPFLTYKLDQVRKQQKKLPTGRNLLHFEDMLHECADGKNKKNFQNGSKSGEHLVNRYVGGSHTITTPQQRITRTGNYFETWGPIIKAVNVNTQQSAA